MAKGKRRVKQAAATSDDNLSSSTSSLSSMATSLSSTDAKELQPPQHCEGENKACQEEVEDLKTNSAMASVNHNDSMRKLKEDYLRKLNVLEEQVKDLKKKQDVQSQLSTYRRKNDEGLKAMQDEIQKLKVQKVQLQCKLKLDSVQSRICKATLEKEILQLKKEGRKNKYEVHKLLAGNQRQKQVIQRKTEEAIMVSNRLKQLVELREASLNRKPGSNNGADGVEVIKQELEVTSQINQICAEYEQQLQLLMDEVEKVNQEAEVLKEENIRLLLQAKDLECREDPELKDLKEDMVRLNSLLKQLEISSAKPSLSDQSRASTLKEVSSHASPSIRSMATTSDTGTSGARKSRQIITLDEWKATVTCCSCTKRSLCKTPKCECRSAGDSCGISCGCSPSKCTNQENHALKAEKPSKVEASTADLISTKETETDNIAEFKDATTLPQTESLLVSEPAPPQTQSIPESHPPAIADDHCGLTKMPLYDIANTLVKSFTGKHNQKKKGRN
ncbi:hypothetical protein MLD38_002007 [Melastoma candidum]|uniref:Uncharacterized protein n=1 Tax=Melastoma candidum TaxID=119954 RepID=A0ACB9SIC5_9MYRT|nr:hypothetical protein MLD38_002007 [Melastoma candidum]